MGTPHGGGGRKTLPLLLANQKKLGNFAVKISALQQHVPFRRRLDCCVSRDMNRRQLS